MTKRILSLFTALAVALSLSACQSGETGQAAEISEPIPSNTTTTAVSETSSLSDENRITDEQPQEIETVIIAGNNYDINTDNLHLYSMPLTDDDIKKLPLFKNLNDLAIDLYTEECEVTDLSALSELKSVETLYINGTYTDLGFISGMTNLTALTLEHYFCETLENVPCNTEITSFICSQSEISDLNWITNFDKLKNVSLTHFACADYSMIGKLSGLEKLAMVVDVYDVDLLFMENLTSLREFNYYPTHKTLNFDAVSKCTNLEKLEIYADIDNLEFCNSLNDLKEFSFYAADQKEYDLSPLLNCSKLEYLNLTCEFSDDDFTMLENTLSNCKIKSVKS